MFLNKLFGVKAHLYTSESRECGRSIRLLFTGYLPISLGKHKPVSEYQSSARIPVPLSCSSHAMGLDP